MAFNGSEGGTIDIDIAGGFTETFRDQFPGKAAGFFLGREHIEELLANPNAKGIRIYQGVDKKGNIAPMWVAADGSENDITSLVKNYSIPCPTQCSTSNALNS